MSEQVETESSSVFCVCGHDIDGHAEWGVRACWHQIGSGWCDCNGLQLPPVAMACVCVCGHTAAQHQYKWYRCSRFRLRPEAASAPPPASIARPVLPEPASRLAAEHARQWAELPGVVSSDADKRLIVSAPEMLALLRSLLACGPPIDPSGYEDLGEKYINVGDGEWTALVSFLVRYDGDS